MNDRLCYQVGAESIISVHNVSDIYKVPLLLKSQNVAEIISNKLKMYLPKVMPADGLTGVIDVPQGMPNISPWEQLCMRIDGLELPVVPQLRKVCGDFVLLRSRSLWLASTRAGPTPTSQSARLCSMPRSLSIESWRSAGSSPKTWKAILLVGASSSSYPPPSLPSTSSVSYS